MTALYYRISISLIAGRLLFSSADGLSDARDQNKQWDVFTWDLRANVATRISVTQDGREGNGGSDSATFSPDGRRIVFLSSANNLVPGDTNDAVDVFVKDLRTGALSRVSIADRRGLVP